MQTDCRCSVTTIDSPWISENGKDLKNDIQAIINAKILHIFIIAIAITVMQVAIINSQTL
jgi:hypothetical protein